MKEWLTAAEWAAEQLPDMPTTKRRVNDLADREGWNDSSLARKRDGRSGGGGFEYHLSLLPALAQVTYQQRHMIIEVEDQPAKAFLPIEGSDRAQLESHARAAIVQAFKKYSRGLQLGYASRVQVFVDNYNLGSIAVADFVRTIVPTISKRSLARWQIDASPVDALCVDGRHSIYACIDLATRRMIFHISRTPRASAVALLMRKAILAWGVPEVVKTDNGSDFVANATERLFISLGIEAVKSNAYSPQEKAHIERGIGTFQRRMSTLLPGFIGHNVADRQAIEAKKAFAQRLGEAPSRAYVLAIAILLFIRRWMFIAVTPSPGRS